MKIIDLLNKIANGEEVPKIIKLNDNIYDYEPENKDYYDRRNLSYRYLFDQWFHISKVLNDEVEILDEPKKIEKLDDNFSYRLKMENIKEFLKKDEEFSKGENWLLILTILVLYEENKNLGEIKRILSKIVKEIDEYEFMGTQSR